MQQRREHAARVVDAGGLERLRRLRDEHHEVVRAVREGRVVQPAVLLVDDHGLAADLDDERLADRLHRAAGAVTAKVQSPRGAPRSRDVPVKVIAGWIASGIAPCAPGRRQHVGAVAAGGVHDDLARLPGPEVGETRHERPEGVVGHREQHELGPLHDVADVEDGDAGQHGLGALAGGLGDADTPTTAWPTARSALPSTAPTRPAPTIADAEPSGAPGRLSVSRHPGGLHPSLGSAPTCGRHGPASLLGEQARRLVVAEVDHLGRDRARGSSAARSWSAPSRRCSGPWLEAERLRALVRDDLQPCAPDGRGGSASARPVTA